MFDGFSLQSVLNLSVALFCIGVYGVMARRNILVVLMSLELMLNAVNLSLVAFGRFYATPGVGDPANAHVGQIFTLMVMAVAAAEAAIALALVVKVYEYFNSSDLDDINELQG